jgi:hypothetical protein
MPVNSGAVTMVKSGAVVLICPWVTVDQARRYWDNVDRDMLQHYKGKFLRVERMEHDVTFGTWAQVSAIPNGNGGVFWLKTCLLMLASDSPLI